MKFSDRVTILIIPRAGAGILSFRLRAGALFATALLFLCGLVGLGTTAFLYAGRVHQGRTIARLSTDNDRMTREVGEIRDHVSRITGDLAQLAVLERDVRMTADLPAVDTDVSRLGVGGPGSFDPPLSATEGPGVDGLKRDVDGLLRRARFQRASLSHVAQTLALRRESLARMPSILPVPGGFVTSPYGRRPDPFTGEVGMHEGVDIAGRRGDPVLATADGVVVSTHVRRGYGLTVEIDHENGLRTFYSHASKVFVKPGQIVKRGEAIAAVGNTGRATAPHCHYEVHEAAGAVNPERFILESKIVFD